MESFFSMFVSDNESIVGDGNGRSCFAAVPSLATAPSSTAAPTTKFQCWNCYRLFPFERALIQHQFESNILCGNFAVASPKRFKQAQQRVCVAPYSLPTKRYYYDSHHFQLEPALPKTNQFAFLEILERSGTNDPFDDDNQSLDLVSKMDHDFVGNFGYAAGNHRAPHAFNGELEELDLELKLSLI